MALIELIVTGLFFVLSSGVLFNERFRRNKVLVGITGLIAVVGTLSLFGFLGKSSPASPVQEASQSHAREIRALERDLDLTLPSPAVPTRPQDFQPATSPEMHELYKSWHDEEFKHIHDLPWRNIDFWVAVTNHCERPIWLAVHYLSVDNTWVTEGWRHLDAPGGVISGFANLSPV
jgi:hypothetical protein